MGEPGLETGVNWADVENERIRVGPKDPPPFVLSLRRRDIQALQWRWGLGLRGTLRRSSEGRCKFGGRRGELK